MVTDKIKELEATKAKLADLEKSIASELQKELRSLPAKFGYESMAVFIKALKLAGGGRGRGPGRARGKRRTRAVITDATRAEVKKMVEAGKSGAEIAKSVGISLPSVQNIKKSLGLVRSRK